MALGMLRIGLVATTTTTTKRTARLLSVSRFTRSTGMSRQRSLSRIVAATSPQLVLGRGYSALPSRAGGDDEKVGAQSSSPAAAASSPLATFKPGHKIQVEVISFGPMGASVDVVAESHNPDDVIAEDAEPLGRGLILQKEISYFRQRRDNVVSYYICRSGGI